MHNKFALLLLTGMLTSPATMAGGHDACQSCHNADEFQGLTAEEISDAVRDRTIPPHGKFSELSDAEVQALAEAMAAG